MIRQRYAAMRNHASLRRLRPPVICRSFLVCSLLLAACSDGDAGDTLRASGTVEMTEVRVTARTPGEVLRLGVEEGAAVQAGDTLAVIDHELMVLQMRQAEAGVDAAEARLALLREGARAEDLAQARAQVEQARIALEQAQADAARFQELAASGSATEKQREDADTRLALAREQYAAARQGLRKLEDLARPAELRAAAAQLKQAQAAVDVLRYQIRQSYLVAPIAGTVIEKIVEPGELVGQGAPVMTLADLSRAYLRIYVPETDLGRIMLGQPVDVYTDTYPDRPLGGRITFISPSAEFTPKNVQTKDERVKLVYEVKVEVPNPDGLLKPGMYADAVLRFDTAS